MKKTNSSDVDFVETTVQNLSHFPQYITVFITRVTGLPLFTERELVYTGKTVLRECLVRLSTTKAKVYG